MIRIRVSSFSLALALFTAIRAVAQQPAQAAALSDATPAVASAYTLKAGAELVVLDVVVKDRKGVKVHDLRQSDFVVKENGRAQKINNFEEHTALSRAELAVVLPHPTLPQGEFTNFVPTPPTGALNVIFYDINNTSVKDQAFMRAELVKYLKHARPDSRTAIYALTTRLLLLQGFTSDPSLLLAALSYKGNPQQSLLRDNTTGGVQLAPANGIYGNMIAQDLRELGAPLAAINLLDTADSIVQANQRQLRAYTTLDALNDLGRILVTMPGRKNLIWFSGDFPSEFFPSENSTDGPYALTAAIDREFRDTVNLLARAQIAVYPIDASGLRTDESNNATAQNAQFARPALLGGGKDTPSNGSPESQLHQTEFALISSEHQAMNQIAHDTGGEAYYDHSDLTRMVGQAIDDGSTYYTLTYVPTGNSSRDGLRSISVNIEGKSYRLSYRHGYFTDHLRRIAAGTGPAVAPRNALAQALAVGSPEPTEILLRTRAFPLDQPEQPNVAKGNSLNPNTRVNRGPFAVFQIDTAASIARMKFVQDSPDNIHTAVDIVTYVYDLKGNLINAQSNTINVKYTKETLAKAYRSGLHFGQQISVPVKGDYLLRIAVHDTGSGYIGALEIPVANIAMLGPSTNTASNSAATPSVTP